MPRTLDLVVQKPKEGDLPHPPRAHIYVRSHSKEESLPDHILVSSECLGYNELKGQVKKLKRELDAILAKGRRVYRKGS